MKWFRHRRICDGDALRTRKGSRCYDGQRVPVLEADRRSFAADGDAGTASGLGHELPRQKEIEKGEAEKSKGGGD